MMTSAQVVETSVNVTSNSPSQDYTHPDDHNLPNYDMTAGFKPFTNIRRIMMLIFNVSKIIMQLPHFFILHAHMVENKYNQPWITDLPIFYEVLRSQGLF